MALALGLGGLLAQALQGLGTFCVLGFGLGQGAARLGQGFGLGCHAALQCGNFLGPRQEAGLLGIGRIQTHAVRGDHVAAAQVKRLTCTQATALGQCVFKTLGAVAAAQPVGQYAPLRRMVRLHLGQQRRQPVRRLGWYCIRIRREKSQLGGRRVQRKGGHHVQTGHLQRTQTLAQGGFQCAFPTGRDLQAAPQRLQTVQPVLAQPGSQLALGGHAFLQGLERTQPGGYIGQRGRLGIDPLLLGAACGVQCGQRLLGVLQRGLGGFIGGCGLGSLGGQGMELRFVRGGQGLAVCAQAFGAALELAFLLLHAALFGGQHLDFLLHQRHGAALGVGRCLGRLQTSFQHRQLRIQGLQLRGQGAHLAFATLQRCGNLHAIGLGIFAALGPLADLLAQAADALGAALAAVDHKADFGFQPADFGAGLVQRALGLVDFVTGGVMGLPHLLQIGLGLAQIGGACLQGVGRLRRLGLYAGLLGGGLRTLQKPLLLLLAGHILLQALELHCRFGLLFQLAQVGGELAQNVFYPGQVLAGVGNAVFGFAPALFVLGDAGGLFQKQAQLFGARFDDAADGALADDGVGTWPQAGTQKHVLHIAAAHRLVVDEIAGGSIAGEHAAHRDFGKLAPLAADAVVGIVKYQLHAGAAGGFALGRAVEDDVLHGLAAQLAGAAFAQHPAHRVHDVGLAAAVGPDHAN